MTIEPYFQGYYGKLGGTYFCEATGPTFESVLDLLTESLYDQMGLSWSLDDE